MRDFGYTQRGRAISEARDEVYAAAGAVVDRKNPDDPRTRRWLDAIDAHRAACARVYPDPLRQVDQGEKRAADLNTVDMLDFLEADPIFYRSGYMKEKLLRELKRRKLDERDAARMRAIILALIPKPGQRREFRFYCRVAPTVADDRFRAELERLERSGEPDVVLRANWVLAALDGRWEELRRAARRRPWSAWQDSLVMRDP